MSRNDQERLDTTAGERVDVAIVGAGILGLAVGRELLLRNPRLSVAVIEKEARPAAHQTGHNSGVIHAGVYYRPGSLKARLCRDGAAALYAFCEEHGVAVERCGKLIIARNPDELPGLKELAARGAANGVEGLRLLSPGEIESIEPHATGSAALHSPATGIVDFGEVARALAADLLARGGSTVLGTEITAMVPEHRGVRLEHAGGAISARRAICCAGGWADRLARLDGGGPDPRIIPFRGQYLRLLPHAARRVRGLIYPVPDPRLPFLGIHLTKQISGEVVLGPTALLVAARDAYRLSRVDGRDLLSTLTWPGTWRMARRWWRTGLAEMHLAVSRRAFVDACAAYVPGLTVDDVGPGPAGVRAQAVDREGRLLDDFAFSESDHALHVRNAPSPAATSSLALAAVIVDRAGQALDLGLSASSRGRSQ
jgi:2-hydroxyglutarate dehydrogenase